ncbi:hypothetical protein CBW57_16670 [Yersinia intermedia]|uniref:Uncharacterized protein n=1 Tax=Yersinia intermedia TaxID=631 RepID=A0A208ZW54_YERIN|nr:hypothetical protein CBW57_16670 [Yersinia intermedia]
MFGIKIPTPFIIWFNSHIFPSRHAANIIDSITEFFAHQMGLISYIRNILQAACALATLVTQPIHGARLYEISVSRFQIGSRPICYSITTYLQLELFRV